MACSSHLPVENQMVRPTAAPEPGPGLEPEREEKCVACSKVAYLLPDGEWNTETAIVRDEDGPFLTADGDSLPGAADTPMGFVCSEICRSQAMYNAADEGQKEALDKVLDACRVLAEYGPTAFRLADKAGAVLGLNAPADFLDFAVDADASWTNRQTREERLERTMSDIETQCDIRAAFLSPGITIANPGRYPTLYSDTVQLKENARYSASFGQIALKLRAARTGADNA